MAQLHREVLAAAAREALAAPSILNTQPWRWRAGETLRLYADRTRQLAATDASGRMLLMSCGAALHHARVALAGAGWGVTVTRHVGLAWSGRRSGASPAGVSSAGVSSAGASPAGATRADDLVATLRLTDRVAPGPRQEALALAIHTRLTDRRPYGGDLPDAAMLAIRQAVEAEGARVHRVRWDQLPTLRTAAERAIATELADPGHLRELAEWTERDPDGGDGVPAETVARPVVRPVPVRTLSVHPERGLPVPAGGDRRASYLVLFGRSDEPADWLRAGEALSAALLTGAVSGVAAAPMSDLVEVPGARALVRSLLAGMGYPYLVLRCGTAAQGTRPGHAPRRDPGDVITGAPAPTPVN